MNPYYWFKHDCNAHEDLKFLKIKKLHTHWAIGLYWEVIEVLSSQKDYKYSMSEPDLQFLCEDLLRCKDFKGFKTWLNDCINMTPESLFNRDENYFWSEGLKKRMKVIESKIINGKQGGRGKIKSELKAKPKRIKSESIANGKHKKRKDKEREDNITKKVFDFSSQYFEEKYINQKWRDCIFDLIEIDQYTEHQIMEAIRYGREHSFWKTNFISPLKLRRKDKEDVKYIDKFLVDFPKQTKTHTPNNGLQERDDWKDERE